MRDSLLDLLRASAPPDAVRWLEARLAEHDAGFDRRPFYYAFSGVSRHFPKRGGVDVLPEQAEALAQAAPGFSVEGWDCFRLARVVLLLSLAKQDRETFLATLAALLNTADFREQAAIFSAFPLLPHPDDLVEAAVDGLRSNIVDVFDSIALDNPFPAAHFSETAWNQMVLKALFLGRPLHRVVGLDARRNAALATSVSDLAHERWAAGRRIPAEAWRNCVGFVDETIAEDLRHLADTGEPEEREAVALLAADDESGLLADLRGRLEGKIEAVAAGALTWDRLGERLESPAALNGSPIESRPISPS